MSAKASILRWAAEGLARFFERHPVLLLITVLAYVFSPIDLFPEALTGLVGFLDDFLMVVAALLIRRWGQQLTKQNAPPTSKPYVDTTAE